MLNETPVRPAKLRRPVWNTIVIAAAIAAPAVAQPDSVPAVPRLSLRLNVAARRLDIDTAGHRAVSYPVAVGAPQYQTPLGSFRITTVEWNPWWIPPNREWARGERPTAPGPTNPMGRVKLYFKPLYFIHGTPLVGSIGSAASHGCVRMRNGDVIALALKVMAAGGTGIDSAAIAAIAADSATTTWVLEPPIPVTIRYDLLEVDRDTIRIHPDVYSRVAPLTVDSVIARLRASIGRSSDRVDTALVRRAIVDSRRRSVAVPLDSVFVASPAGAPSRGLGAVGGRRRTGSGSTGSGGIARGPGC